MTRFDSHSIPYSPAAGTLLAQPSVGRFDQRWFYTAALLTALIGFSALVAYQQGYVFGMNLGARVAAVYCPLAGMLILALGWSASTFPIAAALFYGFLGLNQVASAHYFLWGDETHALSFEMVLALPLIIVALFGPNGSLYTPSRRLPTSFTVGWVALAVAAALSTVTALDIGVAFPALFSRFWIPILVSVAVYQRLRNVEDYKVIWLGLLIGLAVISVYNYRRGVLGEMEWYTSGVSQRFLGASQSNAIPTIFVAGAALWFGHAHALKRSMTIGVFLLTSVALFGVLAWLGASRGAVVAFGLIVAWWSLTSFTRHLLSGRALAFMLLGGVAVAAAVQYSLRHTTLDLQLVIERFEDMASGGITGTARWPIWQKAMAYWSDSPLFGVGLNNWFVVDDYFASVHSSVIGAFFDVGLFGVAALILLVGATLYYGRPGRYNGLPFLDQRFVAGCFAGWVVMCMFLAVNLPFTSGQPRNNIFPYVVFMYPMLAMTLYTRHARDTNEPGAGASLDQTASPPYPPDPKA